MVCAAICVPMERAASRTSTRVPPRFCGRAGKPGGIGGGIGACGGGIGACGIAVVPVGVGCDGMWLRCGGMGTAVDTAGCEYAGARIGGGGAAGGGGACDCWMACGECGAVALAAGQEGMAF